MRCMIQAVECDERNVIVKVVEARNLGRSKCAIDQEHRISHSDVTGLSLTTKMKCLI